MRSNKIIKVMLTQPNYLWSGGRILKMHPYPLGILNACIKDKFETEIFDPVFDNLSEKEVSSYLINSNPDVVCISTISTESINQVELMTSLVKRSLPNSIIIVGGVLPTLVLDIAMKDNNVDYWIAGEGEFTLAKLLNELNKDKPNLDLIGGLAYYDNSQAIINPSKGYIENLDEIPFADYGNLNFMDYSNRQSKYSLMIPKQYPYAVTITARGCPYKCTFCSGPLYGGKKVRMRSAENVLREIDILYMKGIREIIFLDDHFLFSKERAVQIMRGLIERDYNLTWKCCNLAVFRLDEELLDLMKESKCYQLTVSIESGNEYVLNNIIKKPVIDLKKALEILDIAKKKGFEINANFVIGFPDETWDQIRDSINYAEKLNVDLVTFHIATPLPKTELMNMCIEKGFLLEEDIANKDKVGYCEGIISTEEFTPIELQILRAFEWDRINFSSRQRMEVIGRMMGLTPQEVNDWRKQTRRKLGRFIYKQND